MKPEFVSYPDRQESIDGSDIGVERIENYYGFTKYYLHLPSEDGDWPSLRALGTHFGAYWDLNGARLLSQNSNRAVLLVSGSD